MYYERPLTKRRRTIATNPKPIIEAIVPVRPIKNPSVKDFPALLKSNPIKNPTKNAREPRQSPPKRAKL
jgi:hypothetical protein